MRNFNPLFASFLMVSALLLVGCNKGSTPEPEPEPEIITYSATYTVDKISDDFFTLGGFSVACADKDGKVQVENKDKAQFPFTVTIKDLKEDSKLSFGLIYDYFPNIELTKEKYTFERNVSLTIKDSNGSGRSTTILVGSATIGKDKVKFYLDKVTQEEPFESTVKRFISQQ